MRKPSREWVETLSRGVSGGLRFGASKSITHSPFEDRMVDAGREADATGSNFETINVVDDHNTTVVLTSLYEDFNSL